jgi:hypothetical protein
MHASRVGPEHFIAERLVAENALAFRHEHWIERPGQGLVARSGRLPARSNYHQQTGDGEIDVPAGYEHGCVHDAFLSNDQLALHNRMQLAEVPKRAAVSRDIFPTLALNQGTSGPGRLAAASRGVRDYVPVDPYDRVTLSDLQLGGVKSHTADLDYMSHRVDIPRPLQGTRAEKHENARHKRDVPPLGTRAAWMAHLPATSEP